MLRSFIWYRQFIFARRFLRTLNLISIIRIFAVWASGVQIFSDLGRSFGVWAAWRGWEWKSLYSSGFGSELRMVGFGGFVVGRSGTERSFAEWSGAETNQKSSKSNHPQAPNRICNGRETERTSPPDCPKLQKICPKSEKIWTELEQTAKIIGSSTIWGF